MLKVVLIYSIYGGMATLNELVNEFYLYIAADNWKKVRQFDFRSKLMTWIGVVAIRFFKKERTTDRKPFRRTSNSTDKVIWFLQYGNR